jgi:hypothetical protein
MPITGVGSWLPTIDEFIAHWTAVNAFLAPGELSLTGPYDLTNLGGNPNLTDDRIVVDDAIEAVQDELNLLSTARADRDIARVALNPRFVQFRAMVNGVLPGSRYLTSMPATPQINDSPGDWHDAIDDMSHLWAEINANVPPFPGFAPPLLLAGGYAVATFNTESNALKGFFTDVTTHAQDAEQARKHRDIVFAPVYERLKQYRDTVQGMFGSEDELYQTLPALTPAAGHTPDPVNLSGTWDPTVTAARLIYTASLEEDLQEYELRGCFGDSYTTEEEEVLDNNPPGVLEFVNSVGLVAPGSRAFYKVYVKLNTGNERGSNTVSVVRE